MPYFDHRSEKLQNVVYLTISEVLGRWTRRVEELKQEKEEQDAAYKNFQDNPPPTVQQFQDFVTLLNTSPMAKLIGTPHVFTDEIYIPKGRFKNQLAKLSEFPLLQKREEGHDVVVWAEVERPPSSFNLSYLLAGLEKDLQSLNVFIQENGLQLDSQVPVDVYYLKAHKLFLPTDRSVLIRKV
jgi:hypothetical protein